MNQNWNKSLISIRIKSGHEHSCRITATMYIFCRIVKWDIIVRHRRDRVSKFVFVLKKKTVLHSHLKYVFYNLFLIINLTYLINYFRF